MNKILLPFRSGILFWMWLTLTIWVIAGVFATYSSLTASSGENLTYSKWNELLQYTVPPGAVMAFNLTTCPTNWSPADGTSWKPDLRWQFVRWLNTFDGGVTTRSDGNQDPDSRSLGSLQTDALQNITGKFRAQHIANLSTTGIFSTISTGSDGAQANTWWANPWSWYVDFDASRSVRTANETRSRNIALIYCIKN